MLDQLKCLTKACDELGLSYSFFDDNHNCVRVTTKHEVLFFVNSTTSFNTESHAQIAEDKYFTYALCRDVISMPKTHEYIDPFVPAQYTEYARYTTYESIAAHIVKQYELPVIVKRNRGSRGDNVFLCRTPAQILRAVRTVFNQKAKNYDYVALAEEYIPINREFRAITFHKKIILLYEKDLTRATFSGNLSPLHWNNAKAQVIRDQLLTKKIEDFLKPFFTKLPLAFVGFDVVIDTNGALCLIEANTKPGFDYFIRDNKRALIVAMYKTILQKSL